MNSAVVEIAKTIGAVVGLATGIFVTYWQIRQRTKAKELGLPDNPERCGKHEEAIGTLKGVVEKLERENDQDHDRIFTELGLISVEIAKLSRNGSGAK